MKFQYTAFNFEGESVTGEVEAEDKKQADTIIRSSQLFPVEITDEGLTALKGLSDDATEPGQSIRLRKLMHEKSRTADRKFAYQTMGSLLASGVPIIQSLNVIIKSVAFKETRVLFLKIYFGITSGESLVTPMSGRVTPFELAMIDVGEETGQIPEMLLKLADVDIDMKNLGDDIEFVIANLTSVMIESGLPLLRALGVLAETFKVSGKDDFAEITSRLAEEIKNGLTFSQALAQFPGSFTPLFVKMVNAGELGGILEVTLKRISDSIEKNYQFFGFA